MQRMTDSDNELKKTPSGLKFNKSGKLFHHIPLEMEKDLRKFTKD